jgi:hypothetical protein
MCRVNNGKTWSSKQIKQFIAWCDTEKSQGPGIRNNYYHIILEDIDDDRVAIGVVGVIKKKKYSNTGTKELNYNLVIFIDVKYQHYGAGTSAISMCLERYWNNYKDRAISFNIPTDRPEMLKIASKLGLKYDKEYKTNLCSYKKFSTTAAEFKFNPGTFLPPRERRKLIKSRKKLIKMG